MAVLLFRLVVVMILVFILCFSFFFSIVEVEALWCVSRSDASDQALQTALDYACGSGADCTPIISNGLCFLPNTLQAHASYAFNSYFQRRNMAPGSCNFAGTATIAKTDPSYGSCSYPSSPSAAGGSLTPGGITGGSSSTNPTITPPLNVPTPPSPGTATPIYGNGDGGLRPGTTTTSGVPDTQNSKATSEFSVTTSSLSLASFLFVLWFIS